MSNKLNNDKYYEQIRNTLNLNNVFLIGNGFDLALGKLSSYKDFLLYLFLFQVYYNIGEDTKKFVQILDYISKKNPISYDKVVSVVKQKLNSAKDYGFSDFIGIDSSFLALFFMVLSQRIALDEETQNKIFYFFSIHYCPLAFLFDDLFILANLNNKFLSDSELENIYNFIDRFYCSLTPAHDDYSLSLEGWFDVESFIEYIVLKDAFLEKQFTLNNNLGQNIKKIIENKKIAQNCTNASYLLESLQQFTNYFCEFLYLQDGLSNEITNRMLTNVFSNYAISINGKNFDLSFTDFIKTVSYVIDFNYTPTSNNIFANNLDKISNSDFEIYHVNGCYWTEENKLFNNAIFGYTKTNACKVNKYAYKFEKRAQRQIKNIKGPDYKKITEKEFNLFIYGHSCSTADKDVLYQLLTSPNLKFVIVFCYTENDKLSIFKNLSEIIGNDNMDFLTRQTTELKHRLIWAENTKATEQK